MKKIQLKSYLKLSLVSMIAALFSYLFLFYIGNYIILYFAYDFDIGAYFDISGLHYLQSKTDPLWTYDARLTIFLSKPILSFIIAIISLMLMLIIKNLRVSGLLLLIWLNIFAFNACFGIFLDDIITQKGLIFVVETMELSFGTMIFLVGISIFFMIRIGMVNSTILSLFFSQKNKTNTTTRIIVIIILIIIPVIFTFLISFIITGIINDSKVHLTILSSFFIIAVFFFYKGKNIKSSKPKILNITKFDWALSILLLILSLSIYILMLQPISLNA